MTKIYELERIISTVSHEWGAATLKAEGEKLLHNQSFNNPLTVNLAGYVMNWLRSYGLESDAQMLENSYGKLEKFKVTFTYLSADGCEKQHCHEFYADSCSFDSEDERHVHNNVFLPAVEEFCPASDGAYIKQASVAHGCKVVYSQDNRVLAIKTDPPRFLMVNLDSDDMENNQ